MAFIYDLTDTWNAGGTTFNAIKMNVTDTASAAASKLITVQVGGSERFGVRKDGQGYFAGNVGIGTSSPDARLDVLGASGDQLRLRTAETEEYRIGRNASTGLLDFYGSQTGFTGYVFGGIDGERMRITSAGRVGIGTASPTTQLEVYGGASGTFTSVAVGNAATALQLAVDTSNNAQIRTAQSVNMQFFTAGTERMRIDSAGNVGIGTSSPSARLTVAGSTVITNGVLDLTSGFSLRWATGASAIVGSSGNADMVFTVGSAERFRVNGSSGNVGFGTTGPAGRVHAFNSYSNSSDTTIIAEGNIPGLNIRATGGGRFSILSNFGATNTTSFAAATGTNNPNETLRLDHATGSIIIGTGAPNAAAQLQVDSTARGFLPPRLTTGQRDAIATPPDGLVLYNSTTNKLQVRAAGAWVDLH